MMYVFQNWNFERIAGRLLDYGDCIDIVEYERRFYETPIADVERSTDANDRNHRILQGRRCFFDGV